MRPVHQTLKKSKNFKSGKLKLSPVCRKSKSKTMPGAKAIHTIEDPMNRKLEIPKSLKRC